MVSRAGFPYGSFIAAPLPGATEANGRNHEPHTEPSLEAQGSRCRRRRRIVRWLRGHRQQHGQCEQLLRVGLFRFDAGDPPSATSSARRTDYTDDTTPVDSIPVDSVPVDSVPVDTVPVDTTPVTTDPPAQYPPAPTVKPTTPTPRPSCPLRWPPKSCRHPRSCRSPVVARHCRPHSSPSACSAPAASPLPSLAATRQLATTSRNNNRSAGTTHQPGRHSPRPG